jgi:hypothetical protein
MTKDMRKINTTIGFKNGVEIGLLLSPQNELLGLGAVSVGGVPLRNAARPVQLRMDTPDGILYTRFEVTSVADGRIEMTAVGIPWGRTEFEDEYNQNMVNTALPATAVEDRLVLVFEPVSLELGGRHWEGFSHRFEFHSDSRKIHRLWTQATWEIGGRITGNTVLHQGQCNKPVYQGTRDTLFTTTCLKTLEQYGSPQGVSYQLGPRGGLLQAFDFQYSEHGALLMFWPRFGSLSSLLESPAGSDVLHIVDEYRFPLDSNPVTLSKWILFSAGPLPEHEGRDLWWAAHEHVYGGIRAAFGVQPTLVLPEVGLRYSTRVHDGGVRLTVCGEEVDSREAPYAVADRVLPLLAKQGFRRFFPEVMSQSDVTEYGLMRKADQGIHGELHCSSVCATHRFLPAEFWGGMKAWRYMADKARSLGIELGAWFAPHFSPRAPIFQAHPEYRMIAVNSAADGGGYGFYSIIVADWNTGIFQWTLDDLKRWHDEGGLDYLFTDSYSNMGLIQSNFSARMRTNFDALGRFYAELQKIGIKAHSFEGISSFGISRFGLADLRGDLVDATQGVVGQNDFGWWVGEEDMAFNICEMVSERKRSPQEMERILFRLMANRSFASFENQFDGHYKFPEWWIRLNHILLRALPYMRTRRLLPSRHGVSWSNGEATVLWVYPDSPADAALAFNQPAFRVMRIEPDGLVPVGERDRPRFKPGCVYLIKSAT